jgi:hypothetical protein
MMEPDRAIELRQHFFDADAGLKAPADDQERPGLMTLRWDDRS